MPNISVLLADDHAITRQGIRRLLEDEKGLTVIGEARDGKEAVRMATEIKPDVVVMDLIMPEFNGIEATRQIKLMHPHIAVLILSAYDDDEYIFGTLEAGAAGYLLKNVSSDELGYAIWQIYKGEPVLTPSIASKVMNYFRFHSKVLGLGRPPEHLSNRETDIIKLAARGMTNKDIADTLCLSTRTVEGHMRSIFNKLGVASRTEAVIYSLREGWFTLEELSCPPS